MNIVNQLNKIPMWQKVSVLSVLLACVVAAFFYLMWAPIDEERIQLANQLSDLERQYAEQKAVADNIKVFQENIRKLEEDLKVALEQLPREKEIPGLMKDIYTLAKKSGIEFKSFLPQRETPQALYAEIPLKMTIAGNFHEIAVFFDRLGKLSRIVNVSDIEMTGIGGKDTEKAELNVNCVATTFMFIGGGG